MAKRRVTRQELETALASAQEAVDSLESALAKAGLTIAACVHVAEGGSIEKGSEVDGTAVNRCIAAKRVDQDATKAAERTFVETRNRMAVEAELLKREVDGLKAEMKEKGRAIGRRDTALARYRMSLRVVMNAVNAIVSSGQQVPPLLDTALAAVVIADHRDDV